MSNIEWSTVEQTAAQKAFSAAYDREVNALIQKVRNQSGAITTLDDIWQLHDFLSARRHDMDGKYDYTHSSLIFVFAQLIKEGWLHLTELQELQSDKLAKIAALTRM